MPAFFETSYGGAQMELKKAYQVNNKYFDNLSEASLKFFLEHGYVVLNNVFGEDKLVDCETALLKLRLQFALEMDLDLEEYDSRICQWRDLWMQGGAFDDFLRHNRLISAAQFFMRQPSIQLIHDHIIRKPYSLLNSTIPWHQDYPFWPVDTPDALSTWTPLESVSETGGCLEIVDGSHKWGVSPPVDFIMDPMNFDDRNDVVRIPVEKGMMVLLHSLTWHRTNPNEDKNTNRPAHISLWVPGFAKYRPDLSDWHPVNDHVTVGKGEYLNTDKFPRFGEINEHSIDAYQSIPLHKGPAKSPDSMDMFGATPRIAGHIQRIIGESGNPTKSLVEYISDPTVCRAVFSESVKYGILEADSGPWLEELFEKMLVNTAAFVSHRARNVYNDAYAQWWFHIGVKWVQLWKTAN